MYEHVWMTIVMPREVTRDHLPQDRARRRRRRLAGAARRRRGASLRRRRRRRLLPPPRRPPGRQPGRTRRLLVPEAARRGGEPGAVLGALTDRVRRAVSGAFCRSVANLLTGAAPPPRRPFAARPLEQLRRLAVAVEARELGRRPPARVERAPIDAAAARAQLAEHAEVAGARGAVRRRQALAAARVRVGAAVQQQPRDPRVARVVEVVGVRRRQDGAPSRGPSAQRRLPAPSASQSACRPRPSGRRRGRRRRRRGRRTPPCAAASRRTRRGGSARGSARRAARASPAGARTARRGARPSSRSRPARSPRRRRARSASSRPTRGRRAPRCAAACARDGRVLIRRRARRAPRRSSACPPWPRGGARSGPRGRRSR